MSYVARIMANVATRHDITSPKFLANVAICRNVSSYFACQGFRERLEGQKVRSTPKKHVFAQKFVQKCCKNGRNHPKILGHDP